MDEILEKMKTMELEEPADLEVLKKLEEEFHISFPEEYIEFMLLHNGGEGPVGEYGYLAVFGTDEIVEFYQEPGIKDALAGFFFFASDRSGYLYAFDYHSTGIKIVEVPEDIRDLSEIKPIADTFGGFIEYIYEIDDSEFEDILREGELH